MVTVLNCLKLNLTVNSSKTKIVIFSKTKCNTAPNFTFGSINRIALRQKLLKYNIDDKFFIIVKNMYDQAKSCIKLNGNCSQFFKANVEVRQGENLSPVLFSIFLKDLTELLQKAYNGLDHISDLARQAFENDDLNIYFKMCV